MGGRFRSALRSAACTLLVAIALWPGLAAAQEVPIDANTLSQAAQSSVGQLENLKIGSQGATLTVGGKEVGVDLSGLTGGSSGSGGNGYMGMGMMFFGASVLTRLLSTIARIVRPRRPRERWIEA